MSYLKISFWCFLIVFFANYLLPGVQIIDPTKIPHLGGDLIFAGALAVMNSLGAFLFPVTRKISSWLRISIFAWVVNFGAYGLLKMFPLGVLPIGMDGYLLGATTVFVGCLMILFIYRKKGQAPLEHPTPDEINAPFHE